MSGHIELVECRQLKYQGQMNESVFKGIGMIFTSECEWILSQWDGPHPDGPTLIYLPDRTSLYGSLRNHRLHGLWASVVSPRLTYYFVFNEGAIKTQLLVDHSGLIVQRKGSTFERHFFSNKAEKERLLNEILKEQVWGSWVDFVRKMKDHTLQCIPMEKSCFVGFKGRPSLGILADQGGKLLQVGQFSAFPRNLELGRKYKTTFDERLTIQEGQFTSKPFIYETLNTRPIQAKRVIQQNFKRGTHFVNTFIKLNSVQVIIAEVRSIQNEFPKESAMAVGEQLSTNGPLLPTREYTLHEIKEQIYRQVQKKGGRGVLRSRELSPRSSLNASPQRSLSPYGPTYTSPRRVYLEDRIAPSTSPRVSHFVVQRKRKPFIYDQNVAEETSKRNTGEKTSKRNTKYEDIIRNRIIQQERIRKIIEKERILREIEEETAGKRSIEQGLFNHKNLFFGTPVENKEKETTYQNYLKYKNRNKIQGEEQEKRDSTPGKRIELQNVERKTAQVSFQRHKKNFKYL